MVSAVKPELKSAMRHLEAVLENANTHELSYENFENVLKLIPKTAYPNGMPLRKQLLRFLESIKPFAARMYQVELCTQYGPSKRKCGCELKDTSLLNKSRSIFC